MPRLDPAFRHDFHDMPIVGIDDIDDLSVGRGCTIRHIGYDLRRPNAVPLSRNRVQRQVRLSIGKRLFCGQL